MRNSITSPRGPRQGGFALLGVMLALVIISLISAAAIRAGQLKAQLTAGSLQGDILKLIRTGVNDYTMENYPALQLDQPVVVNGVTLAPGASDGQSLSPSIENLIAMGKLAMGTRPIAQLNGGRYRVQLTKVPTGCVGTACNVTGVVFIDQPLRRPGSTDISGVHIGAIIGAVGGDAMFTPPGSGNNLVAVNGATLPNPLGNIEGVVGAHVGFGASGFGRFLIVNDPRDPFFQGNLTLRQNLSIGGSSTFAGPVTVNNTIDTTGAVNVNNCIKLQPDGRGGFSCLNPNDVPAGWAGGVRSKDVVSSGSMLNTDAPAAWSLASGGKWTAITQDAVEAVVQTTGRVAGNRLIPTGSYAPGSACSEPGAVARSSAGPTGVMCSSSIWTPLATVASAGADCPVSGQGAVDSNGRQLYCFNYTWSLMTDFLPPGQAGGTCTLEGALGYLITVSGGGAQTNVCRRNPSGGNLRWFRIQDVTTHLTFVTAYEVQHGAVVQKPTCATMPGVLSLPVPMLLPKTESSSDGGFARFTIDQGGSWLVQLTSGNGNALQAYPAASAILQIYCNVL